MTLPLRKVVFWLHLCAGVFAGAVVLVMSVTGVLLTYEKQMIRWADGFHAPPAREGQARMDLEQIVARARETRREGPPPTVLVRRDPAAPVEVSFGREGSVFVNAYTGEVLGSGSTRARAFFRKVTDWHRWLAMSGERRPLGKSITGICNLAFFFIVVSGFYLWWPRTWTWPQFKQVLWFRKGLPGKARDFNWHNVIGFWSLVPLAVIVWSGVVIGYPWASNLTYRMVGEAPPPPGPPGGPGGTGPGGAARPGGERAAGGERATMPTASARPAARGEVGNAIPAVQDRAIPAQAMAGGDRRPYLTLNELVAKAEQHDANWTIISTRVPRPSDPVLQVTVDTGTGAQPQKRGTLHLDRATGTAKKWEGFEAQSRGRQWRMWMRFAHTGEYYGLTGQTIAGIVTAGSAVLVWTGLALTWRRFTAWRGRSARLPARRAA